MKHALASTALLWFLAPAASLKAQSAPAIPDPITHQLPPRYSTLGLRNGHWWNTLPDALKTGYLLGYADHSAAVGQGSACTVPKLDAPQAEWDKLQKCNDEWFPTHFLIGETVSRLDLIYTRSENLSVSISDALHIIGMDASGKPQSEIEQVLSDARKLADALHKPYRPEAPR